MAGIKEPMTIVLSVCFALFGKIVWIDLIDRDTEIYVNCKILFLLRDFTSFIVHINSFFNMHPHHTLIIFAALRGHQQIH